MRKFNAEVNRQLGEPDVLDRMQSLGFEAAPSTPGQLGDLIRSDIKRYAEIVRRTGASAD